MVSIGIDIGTSNTVVAKVDGQGGVAIHKFEDSDLLPSVIHVEETIWGPTHAVLVLSTSSADPSLLQEPLASLTRGEGTAEPAGSRLVEVPVPMPV